eukprot:14549567-Alexandrium_andersonii.AAC.1
MEINEAKTQIWGRNRGAERALQAAGYATVDSGVVLGEVFGRWHRRLAQHEDKKAAAISATAARIAALPVSFALRA